MNKLTIQINNLQALERLIGGDTEVEIDIRNSVVQAFSEKHLKAIASSDALNSKLNELKRDLTYTYNKEVRTQIGEIKKDYWGTVESKINPDLVAALKKQVDSNISDLVRSLVDAKLEEVYKNVEEKVSKRIDYFTNIYIDKEVRSRIENALKKT